MQLQVTGHHVEVTPALKGYIAAKLGKLEEIFPKAGKVSVILTVEKYRHTAEIHFRAEGVELSAKKTTKDMYASVEEAVAALDQQGAKRKDRLHSSGALRRSSAKSVKRSSAKSAAVADAPKRPKVSRVRAAVKSMSLDEAVDALEASAEPFLLFRDENSGSTSLLFRKADGTYGLNEA